jgi:Domain of unknown function (DUF4440)
MNSTIQQFFSAFLDGFRRQNAQIIADCYSLPSVIASPSGRQVFTDRTQLVEHCQQMLARHASKGLTAERFTVRSLLMLSDDFAVANVAWSMLGRNRSLRAFHTAYNLRRHEGGWTIWAVTAHEEDVA